MLVDTFRRSKLTVYGEYSEDIDYSFTILERPQHVYETFEFTRTAEDMNS